MLALYAISCPALRAKAFGVLRQIMNRHDGVVVRLCFFAANHKDLDLELRVVIGMGRVAACVLGLGLLDRTSDFWVHRIHGGPSKYGLHGKNNLRRETRWPPLG